MRSRHWLFTAAVGAALLLGASAQAQVEKKPPKELASFGTLRTPTSEAARSQALEWLKGVGKTDDTCKASFDAVWNGDRPLLDKVAETLSIGDAEAGKMLAEARDANTPAPTVVPVLLRDTKRPAFFRANLTLAYAKALSNRRIHEEALEALKTIKPEDVVDPAAYLFHRAVSEHAMLLKREATESAARLLDDALDSPERYKMVSGLMLFDMMNWREKDLGWIARKMDNIERRLDLARGGPQTQKMQKEVVARLDEIIKELENRQKGD